MTCPTCHTPMECVKHHVTNESAPALRIKAFAVQAWLPAKIVVGTCAACGIGSVERAARKEKETGSL